MLEKLNKLNILELTIIFIITLLFNLICNNLVHDEVWNYGFAYNIATGLIPYKDFNMIITPLYPFLGALFLIIFGKNFLVYQIFNALICTSIFYYIKKNNSKSYYISYSILLFFSMPGYNLFCLLLLYILIDIENKKNNDYFLGIILGLIFLTKQNIGIYLCISTIFIKDIKKKIKRIIGFIIPIIILLIYLLYNNILYQFIDYTILGISSFSKNNINIIPIYLIIFLLTTIYLIYKYFKTKEQKLIYLIAFQFMAYPIFDSYHVIIPFIPVLTYFLNNLNLNKKIINYTFIVFLIFIFSYNIYSYESNEYSYPNNTKVYKYKKINNNVISSINIVSNYVEQLDNQVFIIDMYAYLIKLEANLPINKFDLLNDGNLGKNGEIRIINEIDKICQKEKCTFILNKEEIINPKLSQYNQIIYKYIISNYQENGKILELTIYEN